MKSEKRIQEISNLIPESSGVIKEKSCKGKINELILGLQELKLNDKYAMLDTSSIETVLDVIDSMKKQELLEKHPFTVWQGKEGKWYTYLPDAEKGRRLLKRSTRKSIDDEIYNYYRKLEVEPTVEEVFNAWVDEKLKYGEIQKQSFDRYKTDFDRFFVDNPDFKGFSKRKLKYVSEEDLEEFIKLTIANMHLTQKAYSGFRTLLNGIFKYGKRKQYTTISITSFMGDLDISKKSFARKIKDKDNEVYQEEEVHRLIEYLISKPDDIRCQGLLLTFQSGMRVGELSGLHPEDIAKGCIHVCRTEVKFKDADGKWCSEVQEYPKSEAGERYIVINEKALDTINNIMANRCHGTYLFMENGNRIRSHAFRRKLMRVCKELGISYRANHKIRKTYGTTLLDNGVDDSIVAEQMGHKDVATTRKYYYFSNKSEAKKREQIQKAISF